MDVQLFCDEVLSKYFCEFASWKFRCQLLDRRQTIQCSSSEGYRPLGPMVSHLVRGYLEHGDVQAALELLQSAQYAATIPSVELVRELIDQCFEASGQPARVSRVVRMECVGYLQGGFLSGHWNALLADLIKTNFMSQEELPVPVGFWDILRSVLELSEPALFLPLLFTLVEQSFVSGILRDNVVASLEDRRLRRRFISTHLFALFRIAGSPESVECIVEIMSLLLESLVQDREYCNGLLDEFYEQTSTLDTHLLLLLLSRLSSTFAVELGLLVLERRFRLGDGISRRLPSPLGRIRTIIANLSSLRIEDRSGVRRNFEVDVFQLLRRLLIEFFVTCRFPYRIPSKSLRRRETSRMGSLISAEEQQMLLNEVRRLTRSVDWPPDVRSILNITVECLERLCPDSVIVL